MTKVPNAERKHSPSRAALVSFYRALEAIILKRARRASVKGGMG